MHVQPNMEHLQCDVKEEGNCSLRTSLLPHRTHEILQLIPRVCACNQKEKLTHSYVDIKREQISLLYNTAVMNLRFNDVQFIKGCG